MPWWTTTLVSDLEPDEAVERIKQIDFPPASSVVRRMDDPMGDEIRVVVAFPTVVQSRQFRITGVSPLLRWRDGRPYGSSLITRGRIENGVHRGSTIELRTTLHPASWILLTLCAFLFTRSLDPLIQPTVPAYIGALALLTLIARVALGSEARRGEKIVQAALDGSVEASRP